MKANVHINDFISNSAQELINQRRWFHQYPELAFKEQRTSDYIVSYLKSIGGTNIKIEAGTGVVCEIGSGDKVGACRFNMDGLPIPEKIDFSFKLENPRKLTPSRHGKLTPFGHFKLTP